MFFISERCYRLFSSKVRSPFLNRRTSINVSGMYEEDSALSSLYTLCIICLLFKLLLILLSVTVHHFVCNFARPFNNFTQFSTFHITGYYLINFSRCSLTIGNLSRSRRLVDFFFFSQLCSNIICYPAKYRFLYSFNTTSCSIRLFLFSRLKLTAGFCNIA